MKLIEDFTMIELLETPGDPEELLDDEFLFYSYLYPAITVVFAMAVMSKFLMNEFPFGFRSFLTLFVVFIGEPLCHFLMRGPSGVLVFGFGCLFVYSILPASQLPAAGKSVFITGCDTGFGHALAKKLDSMGVVVYAGCLYKNGTGATELKNSTSDRLKLVQLDVTREQQVKDACEFVNASVGDQGLWGLVNNAGIWYISDIEMTSEKIFHKLLDVNLFGMIRVTKAFLPLIRKAKGRVVNMSSLTGRVAFESFGAYCVAKFGIEAYSDVLRLEMKKWNVKVCIIEPAGFNTAAVNCDTLRERKEEVWSSLDEATRDTYGTAYLDGIYKNFEAYVGKYPRDLNPVVRVIGNGLFSKNPAARYAVGQGSSTILGLFSILPVLISDRLAAMLSITVQGLKPAALLRQ